MVNAPTSPGIAQSGLSLYTDNLVNGFQNWSWATVNLLGLAQVHSGNYAIAVTDGGNQAWLQSWGIQFQSLCEPDVLG